MLTSLVQSLFVGNAERNSQTAGAATHTSHIFVLLVVAFLLDFLVGFVGLRLHAPHALCPLAVDEAVLLFTAQTRCKKQNKQTQTTTDRRDQMNKINGDGP